MPWAVVVTGNLNLETRAFHGNHHSLKAFPGVRVVSLLEGDESYLRTISRQDKISASLLSIEASFKR